MATRPKAVIESRDGEKLSPITIAKNVLTDDGQNLHDILSDRKEDMMTPTIENSSSMFKVGQGDNVDYSANVVNGAYESMVLKGKSMVNCIQESSSKDIVLPYEFTEGQYVTIDDTKESGALGVELKGQTLVNCLSNLKRLSHCSAIENGFTFNVVDNETKALYYCQTLKPNTEYTFFLVSSHAFEIQIGYDSFKSTGWNYVPLKVGLNKFTLTTSNDLVAGGDFRDAQGVCLRTGNPREVISITNLIIIEGNHVDKDVPYFTGMTSCKMPILHTVGKNLFNKETALRGYYVSETTGEILGDGKNSLYSLTDYIEVIPSRELVNNDSASRRYAFYDKDKIFISGAVGSRKITVPSNAKYLRWSFTIDFEELYQIEYGSTATSYEPYKTSILSLPEEVVLRSLPNGVCDMFNTRTGVYTQYIVERVLDGSESWGLSGTLPDDTTFTRFDFNISGLLATAKYPLNCDKLPYIFIHSLPGGSKTIAQECITNHSGNGILSIVIKKDKLTEVSATGFKQWLSQNPIIVQYELKTPVTTKINLSSTLKSWNTTTHIYSEIPENSLYPTLSHSNPTYPVILKPSTKYSIVANSYSNDHTNSAINFNLGGATASTTVGSRVTTITTPSTLTSEELVMSGRGNKLNHVMVIEGDVIGDESYFEGICDCKSPILSNTGLTLYESPFEKVYGEGASREFFNMMDLAPYVDKWGINKNYTFSFDIKANKSGTARIYFQNGDGSRHNFDFTVPVTTEYVRHTVTTRINGTDYNWKESRVACFTTYNTGCFATIKNIQFALGTSVESYKSNTTTFDQKDGKTIVLRSLPNGVCDTLNVETGEYVQRIGEINISDLSKMDNMVRKGGWDNGTYMSFDIITPDAVQNKTNAITTASNLFPTVIRNLESSESMKEFVTNTASGNLFVMMRKDRLLSADLNGFKQWLEDNDLIIQYELATLIVTTINVQGFPYAYTNGHVILSSGSIEQSLTPKVEYSVVTNRNGQIRSNQKMIERQQKQLDRLQAMVLVNLVNTQYEQTLTNLKYNLKNVREEVK